jgi:WD40 repeat protein
MPPEQARGEAVDERADVYSLGALLYHVLSGRPPVEGNSVEDVIASVITKRVEPVRAREARIPRELDTIIAKAMAPEPAERYPTAVELAEDLRRFQTGQLVGAHHYSPWQLVQRWIARRRTPLAIAAIAVVVLVVGGVFSFERTRRERDAAASSTRALLVEEGRRESLDRHPLRALALLGEAMSMGEATDDLRYLLARAIPFADTAVQRYALPEVAITTAAFSAGDTHVITASSDGHVRVWDPQTAAILRDVDVHSGGKTIVLGGEAYAALRVPAGDDPTMPTAIVDLATGKTSAAVPTRPIAFDERGARAWRFDPTAVLDRAGQREELAADWDPDVIAARATGPDVLVVTQREIVRLHDDGHAITVAARAAYEGGDTVDEVAISAALDRVVLRRAANVQLLLADATPVAELTDRDVKRVALRDDGGELAFITDEPDSRLTVSAWGPRDTDAAAATPAAHVPCAGAAVGLAYSGDGHSLLVQCSDPEILVLDPKTIAVRAALTAEVDTLTVAISRDGRYVLAALRDGSSELWDVTKARDLPDVGTGVGAAGYDDTEHVVALQALGFVREGQASVVTQADRGAEPEAECALEPGGAVACVVGGAIAVYGRADTARPGMVVPTAEHVARLALAPGGHRVAARTSANTLLVLDGATRTASWPVPAGFEDEDTLAFAPDGSRLLETNMARGEVDVIDVATGVVHTWPAPGVAIARWAADGARIVTADAHGKVLLRAARDGAVLATFAHVAPVEDLALAAGDALLFTACDDGTVREWRTATGELVRDIRVSPTAVARVAADPTGERVATASDSQEIALWSTASGEMLQRLASQAAPPYHALAFSHTGARLLAVDDSQSVQQWDTSLDRRALPDVRSLVERFVPWTVVAGRVEPRKLTSAAPAR